MFEFIGHTSYALGAMYLGFGHLRLEGRRHGSGGADPLSSRDAAPRQPSRRIVVAAGDVERDVGDDPAKPWC
jgi:hypothetical protein